jgi:hypothetical protein
MLTGLGPPRDHDAARGRIGPEGSHDNGRDAFAISIAHLMGRNGPRSLARTCNCGHASDSRLERFLTLPRDMPSTISVPDSASVSLLWIATISLHLLSRRMVTSAVVHLAARTTTIGLACALLCPASAFPQASVTTQHNDAA